MDVLVVGSGGREHALVRALHSDPDVGDLHVAPGNPGMAAIAESHSVDPARPDEVARLARRLDVDLVVVGPEGPLVAGVADSVRSAGIDCFGPSAAAARLEGSKAYAKDVMAAAGVPTARSVTCFRPPEVEQALDEFGPPYVVKDDGLAAGKGVLVTSDRSAALAHAAGSERMVIEEHLDGPEVSLFAITDGTTVLPLLPAQDFKRVGDGDTGPNTGGMGAYAPLSWLPADLVATATAEILQQTVDELRKRDTPFSGLLYAGLALTSSGVRVVEFNARFGDPETQVLLTLLESPLAELLAGAARSTLHQVTPPRWSTDAAVTVIVAAAGYPGAVRSGDRIDGVPGAEALDGVHVIHSGTAYDETGALVTAGGRVLSVTAVGPDLAAARSRAYDGVSRITITGSHHRTDIATGPK